ncbi:AAA family ATPase [Xanthobacter autotrophicus]|uniref:AAA family ATPase n=1 Tax=Xanthobacter autotrophicus TaxID=280 RepID=UPI003727C3A8
MHTHNVTEAAARVQPRNTRPLGDILGDILAAHGKGSAGTAAPAAVSSVKTAVRATQATAPSGGFARYAKRGFLPYLIPVIPPDAPVYKAMLQGRGKRPGKMGEDGTWYGFHGWESHETTEANVSQWDDWGANVGLRTAAINAFDIDVKPDPADRSEEAERARAFAKEIPAALADAFGVEPDKLPCRVRGGMETAVFVRALGSRSKSVWQLAGTPHKIELLADGQQIVVSGRHPSGEDVDTNLPEFGLDQMPALDGAALARCEAALTELAQRHGFELARGKPGRGDPSAPARPGRKNGATSENAVESYVWSRRADWVPELLPHGAGRPLQGEWSISSEDLDRDLQERLVIYPDDRGCYDFGTERSHDPLSFIREFGDIGSDGEITYGGCPEYGPEGDKSYAVVGEPDPAVRRPTAAEAARWLCLWLGAVHPPEVAPEASWRDAARQIGRALGLDPERLDDIEVYRWFDSSENATGGLFAARSREDICAHRALLPALKHSYPAEYGNLVDRLGLIDVLPFDLEAEIEAEMERVRATAAPNAAKEPELSASEPGRVADNDIRWIDPAQWAGLPIPPREWLLDDVIPLREVSAIYGEGGVGKTLLAHQLGVCVATGSPFLGQKTSRVRVLAFFCEDSEDELQRRHAKILEAHGLEHEATGGWLRMTSRRTQENRLATWNRDTRSMCVTPLWQKIRHDALSFRVGLIILDTLADVYGGEENDRAQVTSFVTGCLNRLAEETGATVLVLAHPSANGASSGSGHSGSTAWNGKFRARLFLKRVRGAGAGSDVRELEGMKANYGPAGGKLKLRWERGAFSLVASSGLGLGASKIVPQMDDAAEQAVVAALQKCSGEKLSVARNSPYFAPRVLKARAPEHLGDWSQDDVHGALDRLTSRGAVQPTKAGRDASGHLISTLVLVEGAIKPDACGAQGGKT